MGLSSSGEAVSAYLDWLAIVTRDEIAALRQVGNLRLGARRSPDFDRGGEQGSPGARLT